MKFNIFTLIVVLTSFAACTNNKNQEVEISETIITEWARPAVKGAMSGAYLQYTNALDVADTIVAVSSDVGMMTQIHETYTTEDGLSGMREMKNISVEPSEQLILERGGLHVMLMNLKKNIAEGDSITISLTFKYAGVVDIKMPVLSSN
ncbi:MAG: copper chaperone PCu(A)C [Balneolaceae bacterium]